MEATEQESFSETEQIPEIEKSSEEEKEIDDNVIETDVDNEDETVETKLETENENEEDMSDDVVLQDGEVLSGQCGDNLTWKIEDGTLTISGAGDMWDYWTEIAPWKSYCVNNYVKLDINSGVGSIGRGAFGGCNGLIGDLVIPNSVTDANEQTINNFENYPLELTLKYTNEMLNAAGVSTNDVENISIY